MKLKFIAFIFLAAFSLSVHSNGPPFLGCNAIGCVGKLDVIYLNPDGTIQTRPTGVASSLGCTLSGGVYLTLKPNHIHFKNMYSMMLSAHAAQKNIFLRIEDNSPDCEIRYAAVY